MDIYDRYPKMKPYVGKNFDDKSKPSLLLIGESHYLPCYSTQHMTPEGWYSGYSNTLDEKERSYIDTAGIIENSRSNSFSNKAHSIYKNSFQVINKYGPDYPDYKCVADDIAFCNFFLRPGPKGKSLKVENDDVEIANEAFVENFEELKPSAVVFLSKLAHDYFNGRSITVPVIWTPHPGCRWWNRVAKKYCNRKGREILGDYVKGTNWKKNSGSQ
jgi:hypothetical protein